MIKEVKEREMDDPQMHSFSYKTNGQVVNITANSQLPQKKSKFCSEGTCIWSMLGYTVRHLVLNVLELTSGYFEFPIKFKLLWNEPSELNNIDITCNFQLLILSAIIKKFPPHVSLLNIKSELHIIWGNTFKMDTYIKWSCCIL